LTPNGDRQTLVDAITCHIRESLHGRITFATYMDLVLYHPQAGYYTAKVDRIGRTGDFFTSPHLGADFGELLAEQFWQFWQLLQQPDRFTLVEMGAGQGLLAADILKYLQMKYPALVAHLDYIIIERARAFIVEQQQRLQPLIDQGFAISWCNIDDLAPNSITGCIFSNELIDALPVHQVMLQNRQLREIYVAVSEDDRGQSPFVEVVAELSTPRLTNYLQQVDIDLTSSRYADGYRTEVNLAAVDWLSLVASWLHQGYVLTIDYGYPSDRYYHPQRSTGTLQCYYRHRHHDNPYQFIGEQDMTAHVDFTALMKYGDRAGLSTVGFTKQGLFLMSLGLGDRIAAISQLATQDLTEMNQALRRRQALQMLIDPMGLGNFGVLIQGKGIELNEPIAGLRGEHC